MGAEFLGGVFLKRAVVVLLAFLILSGCGKKAESEAEKIDILNIDGIDVPLTEGQEAVSEALGEKYAESIGLEEPELENDDEVVFVLCDENDSGKELEYSTYIMYWMLEDDNSHDMKFLGGLDLYSDMSVIQDNFGEYIIQDADNAFCDYVIFFADGVPVVPSEGEDSDTIYFNTMVDLSQKVKNDEISAYVQVNMDKSDDGKAEGHVFQAVTKK
ncbi:MAG: hypothetical protein ACI4I6_06930 [Hominimerdicola sp.]